MGQAELINVLVQELTGRVNIHGVKAIGF